MADQDPVERHRIAAQTHEDAARRHDEAAEQWTAQLERERAELLERRAAAAGAWLGTRQQPGRKTPCLA
jgi:hypothetical protein